ncbi:MAG: hypothetical protein K0Q50_1716 [Vampirovibrio sp.]|jgi:hypothetical protein|nr:hypothetical protein [Vampirovibrio sp.]
MFSTKAALKPALVAITLLGFIPASFAEDSLWSKPFVKQAAVGAAIGAGAGVLSDRTSVGRGAVAGGLAGAGTGALSQSKYLRNKPLLKNTLQGAVIGTGTSYATRSDKVTGAVLGAGAGAGYHYIRKYMNDHP